MVGAIVPTINRKVRIVGAPPGAFGALKAEIAATSRSDRRRKMSVRLRQRSRCFTVPNSEPAVRLSTATEYGSLATRNSARFSTGTAIGPPAAPVGSSWLASLVPSRLGMRRPAFASRRLTDELTRLASGYFGRMPEAVPLASAGYL